MGFILPLLLLLAGVCGLIFLYSRLFSGDGKKQNNDREQNQEELLMKVQAYRMGIDILVKEISNRKLDELEKEYCKRHGEALSLKTQDHVFRIEEMVYRELFYKVRSEKEIRSK